MSSLRSHHPMDKRILAALAFLGAAACAPASEVDGDCTGDKCDGANASAARAACDGKLTDRSGRGLSGKLVGKLDDPLARAVLRPGSKCPTTLTDVMKKLAENDKKNCQE